MYVLATHSIDEEADATANHWAGRRREADKLMANLREALPNLVYADRDNHVVLAFEESLIKMLRTEPLDQYQISPMVHQGEYLSQLLAVDAFLQKQWGYQTGKEYRTFAKLAELYKHQIVIIRRLCVTVVTGPLEDKLGRSWLW